MVDDRGRGGKVSGGEALAVVEKAMFFGEGRGRIYGQVLWR